MSFMIGPEYESWDHTLQTTYITHLELQHEGTHVPYHIQHNSTRAWLGWMYYRASHILRNTNMVILAMSTNPSTHTVLQVSFLHVNLTISIILV